MNSKVQPGQMAADPVLRAFLKDRLQFPARFPDEINENDEMFLYSLQAHGGNERRTRLDYYAIGSRIFDAVRQIVECHFGDFDAIGAFLDFASGYGRFTRFLLQEMPPSRVWVSDIYADAVRFQRERFGVNGIVSVPDPGYFPADQKFDCIFASSFFSHMPKRTFSAWMRRLYGMLNRGGALIFSVHDVDLLPPSIEVPTGILFAPNSESRTLDKQQYGETYVSEGFVVAVASEVSGGEARIHRIKKGLNHHQDLYVVTNEARSARKELEVAHHPTGYLDICEPSPTGQVSLSGWAADRNPGGDITDIQIFANGEILGNCLPQEERPDVATHLGDPAALLSGWTCQFQGGRVRSDDVVMVKVKNRHKLEQVIAADTMGSLLRLH